jgi:hypothetical protein
VNESNLKIIKLSVDAQPLPFREIDYWEKRSRKIEGRDREKRRVRKNGREERKRERKGEEGNERSEGREGN